MENKFSLIAKLSFATTNIINNFGMEKNVNTHYNEIIENNLNSINNLNYINNNNNINNLNSINNLNYINNFVNPNIFYYNNGLNCIKEDIAEIIVNDNYNSIEELNFTSECIDEKRFDDFLNYFIIDYKNFNVLKLGNLKISENLDNLKSLFYVKEPKTIVLNKKNISYFDTPILADYDIYNVKQIILENINQNKKNINDLKINVNDDFYNTFMLINFSLKTLYRYRSITLAEKGIDYLINTYHEKNEYLLKNLNNLKILEINYDKDNKTYEYSYNYIMKITDILNFKIKLSYIKLKELEDNKQNFKIIDFKTERIFRRKNLATSLFNEIFKKQKKDIFLLKNAKKDISFITHSINKEGTDFLKSVGFFHLKFLKSENKNIFNKYCKKFDLLGENSSKIYNYTMVYNSKLNDCLKKNNPLLKEKYNDYLNKKFKYL